MTPIEVHGLRKAYGGIPAVDGISLSVGPGEVFALLGPNGAGKSTTVEILEGHRRRDSGDVRVLGEDPATAGRRWRSRIGIVLQTATDAADLTVRETVRHYSRFYPAPRDPSLVLDLVGLPDKAGARVRTLSGGQRRRVDVALGIIGNPSLVFLDEPTTGFDPEARRQFWALIRSLAADGTTVLLTTHYLEEAAALADRLAIIAGGRIVAAGTPSTVGGLATAQATVTWRDGTGLHEVRTDSPSSVVAALPPDALDLRIRRPSLEDVYLDLIGARS
ncbi:ABC transporter ATP-binding protein [Dactylosporangium sp. NPDC000521]|uniref:ABC transporter ATP-binding protein n=1 Tax=Dactylosporangium sp. NPDC000521 TaxID=3363975 RepID=UPI0036824F54